MSREAIVEAVHLASESAFVLSKLTPDETLRLAAQVYKGLSTQEIADVEKIALGRGNPVGAKPSEG